MSAIEEIDAIKDILEHARDEGFGPVAMVAKALAQYDALLAEREAMQKALEEAETHLREIEELLREAVDYLPSPQWRQAIISSTNDARATLARIAALKRG